MCCKARAENTFLLALDGDVDFQPEAVIRLVDMMKKNKGVGAACGRIHPTGTGYMPAYQVFEYAVSRPVYGTGVTSSCRSATGCRRQRNISLAVSSAGVAPGPLLLTILSQPWLLLTVPRAGHHGR